MATTTYEAPRREGLGLLLLALAVGAVLRLHALDSLGLYFDELYATRIHGLSLRNVAGVIARSAFYDQHPPLYYLVALAWSSVAGVSEAGVRSLSALCGIATLPVVYLLGRELHSRRVGARAAFLLSFLPLHVYYSREARMYALLGLLAMVSTLLLVRLAKGARRATLAAWLATTCALALTHYFGVVLVLAQAAVVALRGRRGGPSLGAWLATFAVPAAAFAPFAVFAVYQSGHFDGSYLEFSAGAYLKVVQWLGGGHSNLPALVIVPFAALAAAGVVVGRREEVRRAAPDAFAGPPHASHRERLALTLASSLALLPGLYVLANRARLADAVAALQVGRGETAALAALQGRTVVTAALLAVMGASLALLGLALRDDLAGRVARLVPAPTRDTVDPVRSLPRLGLAMLATPFVVTLAAGLLGKPLVLVRNFIVAAPFLALLVAEGLEAIPRLPRLGMVGLFLAGSLFVSAHFAAVPGLAQPGGSAGRWLLHTYVDWRELGAAVPAGDRLPLVVAQHFATDGAVYQRGRHDVVRVRGAGDSLAVGQVRSDAPHPAWREGDALSLDAAARFYWIDGRGVLPGGDALGQRLADAATARHACRPIATLTGGVRVHRCEPALTVRR